SCANVVWENIVQPVPDALSNTFYRGVCRRDDCRAASRIWLVDSTVVRHRLASHVLRCKRVRTVHRSTIDRFFQARRRAATYAVGTGELARNILNCIL
ncbi:MAG: hypothetical protein ACTHJZ_15700, partial [Trinickia sp.]|uniref:hypothetical protein n=1 Tax=Trinickia sp. TaxID=2571163 RepID=UPI003F7EA17E